MTALVLTGLLWLAPQETTRSTAEPWLAAAKAAIAEHAREGRFSGAVLIARHGQVLHASAHGVRDIKRQLPNELDTSFNLGSITKLFTSVAIGQLVEDGELCYETRVGEVLPDYTQQQVRDHVTVHHLLTHTSGIPDYWRFYRPSMRSRIRDLNAYLDLFQTQKLDFEPGSEGRYSNSGVVLLGAMLRAITGSEYEEYVQEHIFEPLGMTRSGFYDVDDLPEFAAVGYRRARNGRRSIGGLRNPPVGSPAGGAFGTVHDMLRFTRALRAGELLTPERLAIHTRAKSTLHNGLKYGYLCFAYMSPNQRPRWYGHDGGSEGVNAELYLYADTGITLIILANHEGTADELGGALTGLVPAR